MKGARSNFPYLTKAPPPPKKKDKVIEHKRKCLYFQKYLTNKEVGKGVFAFTFTPDMAEIPFDLD